MCVRCVHECVCVCVRAHMYAFILYVCAYPLKFMVNLNDVQLLIQVEIVTTGCVCIERVRWSIITEEINNEPNKD